MQNKPRNSKDKPPRAPDLRDVEPGSDADATPDPESGRLPPDPKRKQEHGNEQSQQS